MNFWESLQVAIWIRVIEPLLSQIKRGVTPKEIALSLAWGAVLGVFPLMGMSLALCLLAGAILRLNHALLQIANFSVYFIQPALILFFIRLGERLVNAEPISFSIAQIRSELMANPVLFVHCYGKAFLHGIVGWAIVAPLAIFLIYRAMIPVLNKLPLHRRVF